MTFDTQLFFLLNGLAGQSPALDGVIIFFAQYLAYLLVVLFLALLFFSQYRKGEKLWILLVAGASSIIAGFVLTPLIRFFYHHPRPFVVLQVHQLLTDSSWSFPSRHAAFFFALATALYLYNKKWGTFFFIAAALMGTGRVIAGVHYPSDILGGALIGVAVAYATFYVAHKITAPKAPQ